MQCRKWLAVVWTLSSVRAPPRGGNIGYQLPTILHQKQEAKGTLTKKGRRKKTLPPSCPYRHGGMEGGGKTRKKWERTFLCFFPFSFLACGKTGKRSGGRKLKLRRTAIRERKGEREETSGRDKDPPPPNHLFFSLLLLKTFPFLLPLPPLASLFCPFTPGEKRPFEKKEGKKKRVRQRREPPSPLPHSLN